VVVTVIPVLPTNGWGWSDGSGPVEAPEPFEASLQECEGELVGVVRAGAMKDWLVSITKRHTGAFDGCVNITMRSPSDGKRLVGFAEIAKDFLL
jgi:hypothetical protein